MNATKRKFNALIQGIGRSSSSTKSSNDDFSSLPSESPRPSTTSLQPSNTSSTDTNNKTSISIDEDILLKRRRLQAMTEKNAAALNSTASIRVTGTGTGTGTGTTISNVVLKKWTPSSSKEIVVKAISKFAPSDRNELLKRLSSFQEITDWTPKPDAVNEIEWAKRGWACQGKDRVRCTLCSKELVVKLSKREVDGKEVPVLVASDVGKFMVASFCCCSN